ncbi:hypothetical protein [Xanthovirga aplysinae]|uniref:hypothetical protein n=1 Tax=Xanthovirga aplysinae TaxID=2529853 RepID=UPI0012BB5929|nr:hypothetical protein [Xanthovirga aplysinae]MTI32421.1 hypothetical protein [Xanthovirga aplysinae]
MHIQISFILIILLTLISGCQSRKKPSSSNEYLRWVDDIQFDPTLDDESFALCHGEDGVLQYFNNSKGLEYEGEKHAIIKEFEERYDTTIAAKESGLIRIRFIVNCQGETDRFRILSMDENYNQIKIDQSITHQILNITKSLKGWKPKTFEEETVDYYQYLIFKIHQGKIVKILP